MRNVAHPPLLLLLLCLQGLSVLKQNQQPLIRTWKDDRLEWSSHLLPLATLGTLLMAHSENGLLKLWN